MRFCDLLDEYQTIVRTVDDLDKALRDIRGGKFDAKDVEKDERLSVKMLWGSLKNHREKLREFLVQEVGPKSNVEGGMAR